MTSLHRTTIPPDETPRLVPYSAFARAGFHQTLDPSLLRGKEIKKFWGGGEVPFVTLLMTDGTAYQIYPHHYDPSVSDSVIIANLAANADFKCFEELLKPDGAFYYPERPYRPAVIEEASYVKVKNDHGKTITALGLKVQGKWGVVAGEFTVPGRVDRDAATTSLALIVERRREGGRPALVDG